MDAFLKLFKTPTRAIILTILGLGTGVYGVLYGAAWAQETTKKIVQQQVKEAVPAEVKAQTDSKFAEVKTQIDEVKKGQEKQFAFLKCALIVHAENKPATKMLECDKER